MNCEFTQCESGHWHCSRCGYTSKGKPTKAPAKLCKPGLGDKTKAALNRVGITERIVKQVKQYLGFSKQCGCKKRQSWLNRVGKAIGF